MHAFALASCEHGALFQLGPSSHTFQLFWQSAGAMIVQPLTLAWVCRRRSPQAHTVLADRPCCRDWSFLQQDIPRLSGTIGTPQPPCESGGKNFPLRMYGRPLLNRVDTTERRYHMLPTNHHCARLNFTGAAASVPELNMPVKCASVPRWSVVRENSAITHLSSQFFDHVPCGHAIHGVPSFSSVE